jgi:NAD(P)H-hydrate repair Nnr-like enzyme with NAD(P)H-hydrate epimerase domain
MDLMHDRLSEGAQSVLNIIDDFNREALAIAVDFPSGQPGRQKF